MGILSKFWGMPTMSKIAAIGMACNCMLLPYLYYSAPRLDNTLEEKALKVGEVNRQATDSFKCYETAKIYRSRCSMLSPEEEEKLPVCVEAQEIIQQCRNIVYTKLQTIEKTPCMMNMPIVMDKPPWVRD